ncbi:hypothetical protein BDD43_3380 [Mucilaginibacter gracilis]|uniref:Uncharacterized protein n=1 Tax=Mucilaginibacter gracilis TaxID=423350 RepID=A0A495J470_9SPHI|nr:hypothetical protein [Mucilaginibacter gracilis]RKR83178.1 hypothetical protein BDD43_3380 [Mucilaginibacter gracilis]
MNLETYTLTTIISIVCSFGFGSVVTMLASRRKNNAETRLANAETKLKEIETYSKMVGDFRNQLEFQAGILKNQAEQITLLQAKEQQYLQIIANHQVTERELRKVIEQMKGQIKTLQKQYNEQN